MITQKFWLGNKHISLSDAYLEKDASPMLELIVKVININPSANHPLLRENRDLYEYSRFVQKVREELKTKKSRDEAIICAMEACIREDVMVDFIKEHGSEVRNMLFTEFNMEDFMEVRGEELYQDGIKAGREEGREEGEKKKLIELVCKKLRKGQNAEAIADALEEEPDIIEAICKAAEESAPDYDCEQIYKRMNPAGEAFIGTNSNTKNYS